MKKLFLLLIFMLSMGAFAQKPFDPSPQAKCMYVPGFVTECPLNLYSTDDPPHQYISYVIEICGTVLKDPIPQVLQDIQNYICTYGEFPSNVKVEVKRYLPPFDID
ncbi:hypothetical protein HX004_03680 [Myroides sp. 1354]|uniref:hypothetical protein n=1 Tax=unclassified Myroides TaxID=2642485 RepID=UPI0025785045|nr:MULTISPECIES: hypothetical protein [unclassified Myroides]MDM1043945.1 hypothetical protein [Myroides sp. R163-1]MDM1054880.1 hypothetical protein [Myroides sp. 1354]MDM1068177.1 hypothetical protein [Myroides sp. 1372]